MPYVTEERRKIWDKPLWKLIEKMLGIKVFKDKDGLYEDDQKLFPIGDLNYIITRIILEGFLPKNPKYEDYNAVSGVLTEINFELHNRKIFNYERKKRDENGEVYF